MAEDRPKFLGLLLRRGRSDKPPTADEAIPLSDVALETVRAIADLVAKEYANENEIQKSLDAKTATWIAATGAIIIFAIGTLGKIPPRTELFGSRFWFEIAYVAALGLAMMLLAGAEWWFVRAFMVRSYRRMNTAAWADFEPAHLHPTDAYIQLAGDYNAIIQENSDISKAKAALQKRGVEWFFLPSLVALVVVLVLNLLATW